MIDGDDFCADCGHKRKEHDAVDSFPGGACAKCACGEFLDARDLTFNLHAETHEDDEAHDVS